MSRMSFGSAGNITLNPTVVSSTLGVSADDSTYHTLLNVTGKGYVEALKSSFSVGLTMPTGGVFVVKITIDDVVYLHQGVDLEANSGGTATGYIQVGSYSLNIASVAYMITKVTTGSIYSHKQQVIPEDRLYFNSNIKVEMKLHYNSAVMSTAFTAVYHT